MAVAKAESEGVTLTLKLSPEEAERLKSMMQNEWFSDEGQIVCDLRQVIWHALDDAGVTSI